MKSQRRKEQQARKRIQKDKSMKPSGKSKYALKVKARRVAAGLKTEDAA